jgi:hypothetical protein
MIDQPPFLSLDAFIPSTYLTLTLFPHIYTLNSSSFVINRHI